MNAMPTRRRTVLTSLAAGSTLAVAFSLLRAADPAPHTRNAAAPAAASAAPSCRFSPGETAAFSLESTVRDVRGPDEDHLQATLSWQVEAPLAGDRWRLRAALTDVAQRQDLTAAHERVQGPLTDPFFVDVDAACRFVGFGFPRDWDPRRRQLVQSTLLAHEFVLPDKPSARRWHTTQEDGLGAFTADYAGAVDPRAGLRVTRSKTAYDGLSGAGALGVSIVLVAAEATASFDRTRWLAHASGLERVQIRVQGEVEADLLQRFRLVRDDAKFVAVRGLSLADADFADAFALPVERDRPAAPEVLAMSYQDALAAFLARFGGSDDPSYAAARALAAWLKAHPEAARDLVDAVRTGAIDERARPALFLALELSGTDTARDALSDALGDPQLRGLDRARAASALSDLGAPTQATADRLLAEARDGDDVMVASVSLLGVGGMAKRSDDPSLRGHIRGELERELAGAGGDMRTHIVLDAMGNTGDPALVDAIAPHIDADLPATRQHAAEALGRLDPEAAAPRLLDRLRSETDPDVGAAIVKAMHGAPTDDAVALMSDRLTASTSRPERSALIDWLGAASRTRPDARALLASHVRGETDARLVQQIGAYLPASELR